MEKVKLSNSNLSSQLNKLKQARDEKSNQESEKFIALKKENEKLLHEVRIYLLGIIVMMKTLFTLFPLRFISSESAGPIGRKS